MFDFGSGVEVAKRMVGGDMCDTSMFASGVLDVLWSDALGDKEEVGDEALPRIADCV